MLLGVGLYRKELYLLVLSVLLTLDQQLNTLLVFIAKSPAPVASCGDGGWPAADVQHVAFFVVFLGTFAVLFDATRHLLYAVYAQTFLVAVVYMNYFYNFATPAQIIFGALVGSLHALAWQCLLRLFIVPRCFAHALHWMRYVDTDYGDTLIGPAYYLQRKRK